MQKREWSGINCAIDPPCALRNRRRKLSLVNGFWGQHVAVSAFWLPPCCFVSNTYEIPISDHFLGRGGSGPFILANRNQRKGEPLDRLVLDGTADIPAGCSRRAELLALTAVIAGRDNLIYLDKPNCQRTQGNT